MAENTKALVFKDGRLIRRIEDADLLEVGSGLKMQEVSSVPAHEDGFGHLYALQGTGSAAESSSNTLLFLDDGGQSHFLQLDGLETLSIAADGAISIDFDPGKAPIRTLSAASVTSGFLTFSTVLSSLAAGRSMSLRIKNDLQEDLELAFPLDNENLQKWTWLGGTAPSLLPAGQVAVLSLISYGTDDTAVLAAFSYDDSEQITGSGTPDYMAVFENQRDIRSVAMYFLEEDTNNDTEDGYEINKVGLGRWFGPETDDENQATGLITPAASLHVHSNQEKTNPVLKLQSGVNDDANPITSNPGPSFKFFAVDADPEAVVEGTLGDIASDSTNGKIYFKAADSGLNTGWRELNTGLESFDKKSGSLLAVNEVCYLLNDNGPKVDQATADATSGENWKEARILGFVTRALSGSKVEVQTSGVFEGASFDASGGLTSASVGKPAYLSLSSGKLTTDVSGLAEGDVVAEVGVVAKYVSATQADVVIQPKAPVVL